MLLYVPCVCVDVVSLDKTPWFYTVPQFGIYLFIYLQFIYVCYFCLHFLHTKGLFLFRSWVRYWKIVTKASNITMRFHSSSVS